MVAEYNSTGATLKARYVHGSNAAADDPLVWYTYTGGVQTGKHFLHADHLGSIVAMTNGSSAVSLDAYDEYGIPGTDSTGTVTNTGRFQYTGQIYIPELGMYDYKARIYSPRLGRFMQTDPVGYEGGINIYEYAEDDPVDHSDPSGLAFGFDDLAGVVIGGIIGAGVSTIENGGHPTLGQLGGGIVSGAIVGEGIVNAPETGGLSAVAAGAAIGAGSGAAGNLTQQGIDNATGVQRGFSGRSLAADTATGAVAGAMGAKIPSVRVAGVSAGRNSALTVGRAARARIASGAAATMSAKSALKSAVGHQTADSARTTVGAVAQKAKDMACQTSCN
jgi:RHS repeat-associated protein